MSACVRGCVLRGEHVSDCSGSANSSEGQSRQCRGCLPRVAEYGRLCGRCWGWLQSLVRTMPSLVDHLWVLAEPGVSCALGTQSAGRARVGEGGLYPEALALVDELHAVLATWCVQIAAERGLEVPAWGTRWTEPDGQGDREAIGPSDPEGTRELVRWVDPHLAWCADQEWAGDLVADLAHVTGVALGRFPIERRERVAEIACPRCGCLSLVVIPPLVAGASECVRCRVCPLVLDEAGWARVRTQAVAVAEAERERGERAA